VLYGDVQPACGSETKRCREFSAQSPRFRAGAVTRWLQSDGGGFVGARVDAAWGLEARCEPSWADHGRKPSKQDSSRRGETAKRRSCRMLRDQSRDDAMGPAAKCHLQLLEARPRPGVRIGEAVGAQVSKGKLSFRTALRRMKALEVVTKKIQEPNAMHQRDDREGGRRASKHKARWRRGRR